MSQEIPPKTRTLPRVNLTPAELDWLKIVCSRFLHGFATDVVQLKKALHKKGEWTQGFRPSAIDSRLLRGGKEPTLLGLWHADPNTDFVDKCDSLLKEIKRRLLENPSLTIKTQELGVSIGASANQVSLLLRLIPDLGFGHTVTGVANQGQRVVLPDELSIYETLTIDDPEFVDSYLGYQDIAQQISDWHGGMIDIFVSHSSEEKTLALGCQSFLREIFGPTCVLFVSSDPNSMEPGAWFEHIVASLKRSRVLLLLISHNSQERPWLHYEAGVAEGVAIEASESGFARNIIPVVIGSLSKSRIPWPLARYQAADIHDQADVSWMINRIAKLIGREAPPVNAASFIETIKGIEAGLFRQKERPIRYNAPFVR